MLGSLALWLGIPAGWLWLVSRFSDAYPTAYAIALVGCPATMALWALALARLNGAYLRVSGALPEQRRAAWVRGLAGGRSAQRASSVLDGSMTASVVVAVVAITVWFLFYSPSGALPFGD